MLALLFTLLVAVYLLGPDLISRWILGFAVPRKAVVQTKAEELARAVLWATAPLLIALGWTRVSGMLGRTARWSDLRTVFSGLYSTTIFEHTEAAWYSSFRALVWLNFCVLWRLYLLIIIFALGLNLVIRSYGPLRRRLPFAWMKTLLATLVLPRVAEWHVLLSPMLLPLRHLQLYADVLTKNGTLYQGRITDKILNADGSIQSLTLTDPKRFLRDVYKADETNAIPQPKEHYWREIPGNVFVMLGSDISNLNLRYQDAKAGTRAQQFLLGLLKAQAVDRASKAKR